MRSFKLENYHRKVKAVYKKHAYISTARGMKMEPIECKDNVV